MSIRPIPQAWELQDLTSRLGGIEHRLVCGADATGRYVRVVLPQSNAWFVSNLPETCGYDVRVMAEVE